MFTDVTGSTSLGERLDPESLRKVMSRYFDAMRDVIERHGGTVEKFIGDAVMAVFGIPQVHEDDALRAVRAAFEMRGALDRLNAELRSERGVTIVTRTGVHTGEVVASEDPVARERLVTGDTVNVAARLEQASEPGETLIGSSTYQLVRDAVDAEPVEPLALKGKSEPVPAYRLLSVRSGAPGRERHLDSQMVGRERQLRMLAEAFEAVRSDRSCHLFTVLGSPGVGKSRLIQEFLGLIREQGSIYRGRCLSYGDGITFWPVAEIVYQATGIAEDDAPAVAAERLRATLAGTDDAEALADRIGQLLGLSEASPSIDETFWAIRKLFETLAAERPVVIVIDDIHWAEPTLIDLIEHIADLSRDAPLLLLCMARPELLDVRPNWGGGMMNATSILLEPLSGEECDVLLANLLGAAELPAVVRDRIMDAAEGNPLFVEEMLGMLIDDGLLEQEGGRWVASGDLATVTVPPTIHALLAARLDRLAAEERSVIERGSVEGKIFHMGGVAELSAESARAQVRPNLIALVRKELIRPERSTMPGDDAFRFRHLLLRDAAYESMPKETRADLHERFAAWLETRPGDHLAEYEAIVAYHLEQAWRYRAELGGSGDAEARLADRAVERYLGAGRAASDRGDTASAVNLLGHARDLARGGPARVAVLLELGTALSRAGEWDASEASLASAQETAIATGDRRAELLASLRRMGVRSRVDPSWTGEAHVIAVRKLIAEFEELGDVAAAAEAYFTIPPEARRSENLSAATRARELAASIGDRRLAEDAESYIAVEMMWGSTPAVEAARVTEQSLAGAERRIPRSIMLATLGVARGMLGEFDEARELIARSRAILRDLGLRSVVPYAFGGGYVEMLAGDVEAAGAALLEGYDLLNEIGERNRMSSLAGALAWTLALRDRVDEAERFIQIARDAAAADDEDTHSLATLAATVLSSRAGDHDSAVEHGRSAVAILEERDAVWQHAIAIETLGDALAAAGRAEEAAEAYRRALGLFQAKGIVPLIARVRERLAELG